MKEICNNTLTFIFFFLLAFCHANNSYQCGKTITNKIIHGKPVDRGTYPWMVSMVKAKDPTSVECGGALITGRYVVTAKHCTNGPLKKFKLLVGTIDLNLHDDSVRLYSISSFIQHPGDNDIALIKTKRPVRMDRYVQPICLPSPGRNYADVQAVVIGFGETNPDVDETGKSVYSNVLLGGVVNTTSTANCNSVMARHQWPTGDDLLCAGSYDGQPDHCYGDSGGPLMYFNPQTTTWQLIGVVSSAFNCDDPHDYSYYDNVTYYRDWIVSNSDVGN